MEPPKKQTSSTLGRLGDPTCLGSKLPRSLCAIGLGSCLEIFDGCQWIPLDRNCTWIPEKHDSERSTFRMTSTGLLGVCFVLCVFNVLTLFLLLLASTTVSEKWRDWMEFLIFWYFGGRSHYPLFWDYDSSLRRSKCHVSWPRATGWLWYIHDKCFPEIPIQTIHVCGFYGSTVALDIDFQSLLTEDAPTEMNHFVSFPSLNFGSIVLFQMNSCSQKGPEWRERFTIVWQLDRPATKAGRR